LAIVDPLGRVAGVGRGPLGWYEARGSAQLLGLAGEPLDVGWGFDGSDGSGVGV
jgi:hypothetical protein